MFKWDYAEYEFKPSGIFLQKGIPYCQKDMPFGHVTWSCDHSVCLGIPHTAYCILWYVLSEQPWHNFIYQHDSTHNMYMLVLGTESQLVMVTLVCQYSLGHISIKYSVRIKEAVFLRMAQCIFCNINFIQK